MTEAIFQKFEACVDNRINKLQLLNFPVRVGLTRLFMVINGLCCEEILIDAHPPRPYAGWDLISRSSYLIPLFCRCPAKPEGASASDAVSALGTQHVEDFRFLLQFAHFSEIAPYVHRDYFKISGEENHIHLSHKNDQQAQSEVVDIVLSYISTPLTINPKFDFNRIFDKFASQLPKANLEDHLHIYRIYFDWFETTGVDNGLLCDDAMQACASVSTAEFNKFRSAWQSVAEFHIQIIKALTRKLRVNLKNQHLHDEYLEWIAPLLPMDFLQQLVMILSGLEKSKVISLLEIYSFSSDRHKHTGEGFFPPIFVTDIGYLFSPYILKTMLSPRNVLYAALKNDLKTFDNIVSSRLEPQLLRQASKIFTSFSNLRINCNLRWREGEFDLLAYSPTENAVLHIQAKAAIPPEGARMVTRAEGRVNEAIAQLVRFSSIDPSERDQIVSSIFGEKLSNVSIINCVLGWANFGSNETWEAMRSASIIPLNVTLLTLLRSRGSALNLKSLYSDVYDLIDELVKEADPQWETSSLDLTCGTLTVPLLKINLDKLANYRVKLGAKNF